VFLRVTEAWGLARASLTGAADLGGAAAPRDSAGPSAVEPALPPGLGPLLLWCSRLIRHDHDKFSRLGAGAWILTRCEPA
jgi:hypothetical protein